MIIKYLIRDLNNICMSYLEPDEQIYYNNEWDKFSTNDICNIAAKNNWLDVLEHVKLKNECFWSERTYEFAASNGNLDVLKWLYKNESLHDRYQSKWACVFAASKNHLDVLKWLYENGWPFDETILFYAKKCNHPHILEWVHCCAYWIQSNNRNK